LHGALRRRKNRSWDIIAQRDVPILPNDSAESLHARIQIAEHELYPTVIAKLCRENDRRP